MTRYNVLFVDDDKNWVRLLDYRLSPERYRVFWTDGGEKALKMAAENPPDLAILDIRLPDMTGQELCRRLRLVPGLERLPIVAFSNYDREMARSLELGADAFVSKDSVKSEIALTVEALLRRVQMDTGVLVQGDLRLDPRGNVVYLNDSPVATLTRTEFHFFYALVKSGPAPVGRKDLLLQVLHREDDDPESRALEMLVSRTRKRLGRVLSGRIKGSHSFGWLYLPQAEAATQTPTPRKAVSVKSWTKPATR